MTARSLLIRLPNWLGDMLMARPLLHALRAGLPDCRIAALGPAASRILDPGLWDSHAVWPPEAAAGAALGEGRFDVALLMPPSFSSAWWPVARRARVRIGFAAEHRSWLLTHAIRRPARGEMHLSEEYLGLGAPLGLKPVAFPPLRLGATTTSTIAERRRSLVGDRPHAVLGPGAVFGPAKRWPEARFVELGRRLIAHGFTVLVCGARSDRPVAEAIAAQIGTAARSLAGQTGIEEQLDLCASARVTVSNDSGLAHLAAATGAPTVVIFGSTSSAWTAPLGPRVTVIQHAPVCSPCFRRTCRIGYGCLTAVEVAEVERACLRAAA